MQILHAGRYGYHPLSVAPSRIKSPITPFTPRALSRAASSARSATSSTARGCARGRLRRRRGDGLGGLPDQRVPARAHQPAHRRLGRHRSRNAHALPVEIVRRMREAVGRDFIIIYRLSMLDLVEDGQSWDEIVSSRRRSKPPAPPSSTPASAGTRRACRPSSPACRARPSPGSPRSMKAEVAIPLITTNRINMPDVAERILAGGDADMVSMARPLLADPDLVSKARDGRADEINTCIACNQACLDHVFENKRATCLVNPRACHETELLIRPATAKKRIAVVGAGPGRPGLRDDAGRARPRGHAVRAANEIGGQFNMAKRIPGKEEFHETLRYFGRRIATARRRAAPGRRASTPRAAARLRRGRARHRRDAARRRRFPAATHRRCCSYIDVLRRQRAGRRARRDRRRRRHRLRRRRIPGRRPRPRRPLDVARWIARMGRRPDARRTRRPCASRAPEAPARAGLAAAAHARQARQAARQDHRLGPSRDARRRRA